MHLKITALFAATILAGCATMPQPGGAPVPIEREEISYSTAPCFGTCPVYTVTVHPDGSGVFEGKAHTAVTGLRSFTMTPDAYRRFATALAPYRPASGERLIQPGSPDCGNAPTDMPGVDVHWTGLEGAGQHLSLYYGCRPDSDDRMRTTLRAAPDLLPIAAFIGKR